MNLYFVRHGETKENQGGSYYGSLDVELTEQGILQSHRAEEILRDINFKTVYISEKKRAEQTADILLKNKHCNLIRDSRINETNFGEFEGKAYDKIKELYPAEWRLWCENWRDFAPPGGESYLQVYDRVKSFMDDILKLDEENILIVTHGGVIRSIYCYILGGNLDFFWSFGSKNCDITLIKYEYGNLFIDSITHV
ncbi:alpha-ribazole phosphatase [Clostridium sp. CX1]|uniref:alpha-ribazole phosphatase n=1 Tax=Clostridium sp. CX1 TaxID=2978346 RepID=UPI0021C0D818|nr:alpha-ribazole phosphatase [Clostridium sp. CX1]MCT8978165.1 alpha-ribazole phosphatase [Clostridium sp. CX1]